MHAATHYVERYEVHDDNENVVAEFAVNFDEADSAFTKCLDTTRAAGGDVGRVKLVAVLAVGE